jgi:hypothetical protein
MIDDFTDEEGSPDKGAFEIDEETGRRKKRKKISKMCPNLMKEYKRRGCDREEEVSSMIIDRPPVCEDAKKGKCRYAHNPIELDLVKTKTKKENLDGVIKVESAKLHDMKPITPWKPAKAGDIEHTYLMDMASKKRATRKGSDDEDDEPKKKLRPVEKKSIFEREDIMKMPYKEKDED